MKKIPRVFGATATVALGTALAFAAYAHAYSFAREQERGGQARGGASAQRGGEQHGDRGVGDGHIPAHGPTRGGQPDRGEANRGGHPQNREGGAPGNEARRGYRDQEGHPEAPHVHAENDQWVGHEGRDAHYHLDHPWEHGRFPGTVGPRHVWRLHGGRPDRFEIGGFFFSVAPYDADYCGDWQWDSDDIVLYDDPEDPG
jgi:hypothetical protein